MAILDSKVGHIKSRISKDRVVLKTMYPFKKGELADEVEINLYLEGSNRVIKKELPYGGYNMHLFLGDFLGSGRDCILVKGRFQGSGGIAILLLYEYDNGEIREITNQWEISARNKAIIRYLPNYKVEVSYGAKEKYIVDLSSKDKSYLNLIYDEKGNVKLKINPGISDINTYYEIKELGSNKYDFLIRQNIIGIVLVEVIGIIQSRVVFNINGNFVIKDRELIISKDRNLNNTHN